LLRSDRLKKSNRVNRSFVAGRLIRLYLLYSFCWRLAMLYPNERAISFILSCRSLLLIIRSALLFIISISASRKSERKSEQNDKFSHHNISSCFFLYFLNKRMNIPEFFTSVHRFSKHALEKVFKKKTVAKFHRNFSSAVDLFYSSILLRVFPYIFFISCFEFFYLHPELQKLQFFCSPSTYRLELLKNF